MIAKKKTVRVKRKNTPVILRQNRVPREVSVAVTRYRAGSITYEFDINQSEFEVLPEHLPLILAHCDMEFTSSLKAKEAQKPAKQEQIDG